MEENIIEKLTGIKRKYITLKPEELKNGHGGSLSVKIVIPSFCQANCSFCFNHQTIHTQKHNYCEFFNNITKSLDMIYKNIKIREITLDITGNEPTFDVDVFKKLMNILKKYKKETKKIVLTTNGFHLKECIYYMEEIVDIVNISVHHYDYKKRTKIFDTKYIPDDKELREIVNIMNKNNIKATAVVVLYKRVDNFKDYYSKLITWSIDIGFKDIRIRSNFCKDEDYFDEIIDTKFEIEKIDKVKGLITKVIKDKKTNLKTYIFKGVPDLTKYNIGAELVIDDDGKCYIDYNKRYQIRKDNISYFNNFYVLK